MSIASRPDSPTYFTTHPGVDPDVGAALDLVLNYLISKVNSLDNENIDGSPAIAVSKIDLSGSGFLPLTGGTLSAILNHAFEGVWQKFRADGNGQIRFYNNDAGATWGVCYNTEYNSGWDGRDVTDVCWRMEFHSDGLHVYWAVSAASGIAPTWTELLHVDLAGIKSGSILPKQLGTFVAADNGLTNATKRTTAAASYTKLKETQWKGGPATSLRIAFDMDCDASKSIFARVYRNGVAVGTARNTTDGVLTNFSEDITASWVYDDLIQVYGYTTDAGWPISITNLVISATLVYGIPTGGY